MFQTMKIKSLMVFHFWVDLDLRLYAFTAYVQDCGGLYLPAEG